MYILSQNKEAIVSTENGEVIAYYDKKIGFKGNSNINLGEYDNWDRCLEIIQEIAEGIEKEIVVFRMPQE